MKQKLFLLCILWIFFTNICATEVTIGGYRYELKTKTATIIKIDGSIVFGHITLPSSVKYNGKTYTVTVIGKYAFNNGRDKLLSVAIPSTITSIEYGAFANCCKLESITIPSSVTSVSIPIFDHCEKLSSITVSKLNEKYDSRDNCNAIIETATNTLITGCKTTQIPNSVTTIGKYAFQYCDSLVSVIIPNSVTAIGEKAFNSCTNLRSIAVEKDNPFFDSREKCNAVIETSTNTLVIGCRNTFIPSSVTGIGECAFSDCSCLTSVMIPNSVTDIGYSAFYNCIGLTSVVISNSVKNIGSRAFEYCTSLTSLVMPNNVRNIGYNAFCHCEGLISVTIPDSINCIAAGTFDHCNSLSSVVIPNTIDTIYSDAFRSCKNLEYITIGKGIKYIGEAAFLYNDNLRYVKIEASEPPQTFFKKKQYAFNSGTIIYVPFESIGFYSNWNDRYNIRGYKSHYLVKIEYAPTSAEIIFESDDKIHKIVSSSVDSNFFYSGDTIRLSGLDVISYIPEFTIYVKTNDHQYYKLPFAGFYTSPDLSFTTYSPENLSSDFAVFFAQTNAASYETGCGFQWALEGSSYYNTVSCVRDSAYMRSRIYYLSPDTKYKYRPYYKSNTGKYVYGEWNTFTTISKKIYYDATLNTYEAEYVTEHSAILKGYALPGSDDFTEQGFEYWAENRNSDHAPHRAPQDAIGEKHTVIGSGIRMQVTLDNLDEGTVYKYRTYAKTGDKTFYGSEMTFITEGEWIEYTITATSNDATMGTVTGGGTYHFGSNVTIEAVPIIGHQFVEWSDGNTENPRTVTVSDDAEYTAIFKAKNPSSLTETESENTKARKYIENGILYIRSNGVTYTAQGQRID